MLDLVRGIFVMTSKLSKDLVSVWENKDNSTKNRTTKDRTFNALMVSSHRFDILNVSVINPNCNSIDRQCRIYR